MFQIIRALEDKLASAIEADSQRREKDMKKMKLRYEVMARMELNAKLSEVNAFLERRAEEQTVSEQERDRITDHIQKDLSSRLQQSRQELISIRQQMKGKISYWIKIYHSLKVSLPCWPVFLETGIGPKIQFCTSVSCYIFKEILINDFFSNLLYYFCP